MVRVYNVMILTIIVVSERNPRYIDKLAENFLSNIPASMMTSELTRYILSFVGLTLKDLNGLHLAISTKFTEKFVER